EEVRQFLDRLTTHYVLDYGKLVVAHAGLREDLQGRVGGRVRSFALFGDTTGETDEFGLPVRLNWAADYRGQAMVVYGHTPVAEGNRLAALEVMSRFAANPRWLVYLPPTMAPPESSKLPGLLEHPAEVFDHYRKHHIARVVCQEKHMGSRAVVIVCRDEAAAV